MSDETRSRAAIHAGGCGRVRALPPALASAIGFCTYGNVDNPALLKDSLPETMRFLDGEVVEIGAFVLDLSAAASPRQWQEPEK